MDNHTLAVFAATYFATTLFTTVTGGGGGMVLLGLMAGFVPANAIIPLHAVLLLNGNVLRTVYRRKDIHWQFLKPTLVGIVIGVVLGGWLNISLPEQWLQYLIGSLMLYTTWAPKSGKERPPWLGLVAATGHGFLSSAFGMGGVLQSVVRSHPWSKHVRLATLSAAMTSISLGKVAFFGAAGFDYWPYASMLAVGLMVGVVAVKVGLAVFAKLSERQFNVMSDTLITLLALNMLRKAMGF